MERLLILNPGSTSTKLAVFDGEAPLFAESIVHTPEELAPFEHVADQYELPPGPGAPHCLQRPRRSPWPPSPPSSPGAACSPPLRRAPTRSTTTWSGS